jgi:hypothetical protein
MTDRRYDDKELAEIFRAAAEGSVSTEGSESRALAGRSADGLTLDDLQAIAREVGIAPDAVERAARALDRPRAEPVSRTLLGLPIGVARTVTLDRRLTDAEWELLVVELREVFGARGTMRAQGSLREWRNGNLHAYLEPTPTGSRLRLGTTKGNAAASIAAGSLALITSTVVGALSAANGTLSAAALGLGTLAAMGTVLLANGVLGLPRWARLRGRQMDGIVERLTHTTRDEPTT